jgi:hypothetical protein
MTKNIPLIMELGSREFGAFPPGFGLGREIAFTAFRGETMV